MHYTSSYSRSRAHRACSTFTRALTGPSGLNGGLESLPSVSDARNATLFDVRLVIAHGSWILRAAVALAALSYYDWCDGPRATWYDAVLN